MIETYRTILSFYYQERQTNNIKVLATFYIKAYISYFLKINQFLWILMNMDIKDAVMQII